ncbi:MAG: hypothetical protein DI536_07470 [Archangium gephyra]|uniref:Uncharacterized protein n=1 Tax=Archangium gephyra TaxID=48 RepID=A0A2W5VZE9_9BACT|nr:MAG: hypothetical protein DI536_07470 [Archangium gephyra]
MTTEAKKPSVFSRAEGGARQVVLQIGLGVAGFVIGGLFSAGVSARIAERFGYIENATIAFVLGWLLQRAWLLVIVPLFGWTIGRLTALPALRFAVVACVSGEVFSVLLYTAVNGFDALLDDPPQVLTRLVTLFIGMAITVSAVSDGRRAQREAQAEAAVIAEKNKAEYAEFLKQQEAATAPPAAGSESDPGSH